MEIIDALMIARAAIRTSNGAIAVLTKRNSIGEPTVMIVWRDDGSWSTDWLLKKVAGDDWEPLVERLWAGDDIEELEAENANLRKECDKLKAEKAELTAELEYVGRVVERFKDGSELVGEEYKEGETVDCYGFYWRIEAGELHLLRSLGFKCGKNRLWKYTGPTTAPIPEETATDEEPDYVVQVDEPTTLADMCDIILAADSTKADKLTAIAMLDEAIDPKPLVELSGE